MEQNDDSPRQLRPRRAPPPVTPAPVVGNGTRRGGRSGSIADGDDPDPDAVPASPGPAESPDVPQDPPWEPQQEPPQEPLRRRAPVEGACITCRKQKARVRIHHI